MNRKNVMNRKRRTKKKVLRNRCIVLCLLSAIFIAGIFGVLNAKAQDDKAKASDQYYKSIEIQYGDSLWSIAEQYITDEYDSIPEYIDDLMQINKLTSDVIHEARFLTVICDEES